MQADESLKLTHVVQIRDEAKHIWVEAFVDAHSGEVVQITDFVSKASVSDLRLPVANCYLRSTHAKDGDI
jgi:hypothetical protein